MGNFEELMSPFKIFVVFTNESYYYGHFVWFLCYFHCKSETMERIQTANNWMHLWSVVTMKQVNKGCPSSGNLRFIWNCCQWFCLMQPQSSYENVHVMSLPFLFCINTHVNFFNWFSTNIYLLHGEKTWFHTISKSKIRNL